jgi:hypothetical protein
MDLSRKHGGQQAFAIIRNIILIIDFQFSLMHHNHVLSFFMGREEFLSQSLELRFTNKQIPSG